MRDKIIRENLIHMSSTLRVPLIISKKIEQRALEILDKLDKSVTFRRRKTNVARAIFSLACEDFGIVFKCPIELKKEIRRALGIPPKTLEDILLAQLNVLKEVYQFSDESFQELKQRCLDLMRKHGFSTPNYGYPLFIITTVLSDKDFRRRLEQESVLKINLTEIPYFFGMSDASIRMLRRKIKACTH